METKQDFVNGLRRSLTGKISAEEIEEHIRYYEEYITAETQMRGSEKAVLDLLGDPKLIAMSICAADAAGECSADGHQARNTGNRQCADDYTDFHNGYNAYGESQEHKKDDRPFIFRHPKITIALIVAIVILIIVLFIALAFSLLKLLWPALVAIIAVVLLVRLITYLQDHI
ncbi:MAG: DUF1700 domain-containing protein [Lachnospiraceae bacterium]|nr:DUF1700 domain-containing protein [Lachnospiraceae bacterium]